MKVTNNLARVTSFASRSSRKYNPKKSPIGKVYGVITTENTPTKELFEANGGFNGIGTIFYLDYNENTKNIDTLDDLSICTPALPYFNSNQNYPVVGELVFLIDGPSSDTQLSSTYAQKCYIGDLNVWNNPQQNILSGNDDDSDEKDSIRNLLAFKGDRIYQGRKGNGIRFGSTIKSKSNINEWSKIGNNGDPITILVNGYVTKETGSLIPNIEEINKEKSSIYMTSTQTIPLMPGASIVNPQTSTLKPKDYSYSQIILNSDRVTLNSKKDEVLLFAKTNIELNTDNIINLNAKQITHINSDFISLGTDNDGTYASEPVLLGCVTNDIIIDLCNALKTIAGYLAKTTIPTSDGAICITDCNTGGENLLTDLENILTRLEKEENLSKKVYTS